MMEEATSIFNQFPQVFRDYRTFGDNYTMKIKDNARPYSLYTLRRVPFPLRKQVWEELQRMESLGDISKVNDHTPWCAGMVVVRK